MNTVGILVSIIGISDNFIENGLYILLRDLSFNSSLKLCSITDSANYIRNYGIFILLRPMCFVIYLKSENGESITIPLILDS